MQYDGAANLRGLGKLLEGGSDASHQLGSLCRYFHLHHDACFVVILSATISEKTLCHVQVQNIWHACQVQLRVCNQHK